MLRNTLLLWFSLSTLVWAQLSNPMDISLEKDLISAEKVGSYTHQKLLTCSPNIEAVYQYISADKIRLLAKNLRAGTRYQCQADGTLIKGVNTTPFSFDTSAFNIEDLQYYPEGVVRIIFNDDVDQNMLKRALKIYKINKLSKVEMPVSVTISGKRAVIRINDRLTDEKIVIELPASFKSIHGAALAQKVTREFGGEAVSYKLDPSKRTMQIYDAPKQKALDNGKLAIRLYFYSRPNAASLKKYVKIKGVDTFTIGEDDYIGYYDRKDEGVSDNSDYYVDIEADFKPGKTYKISLLKGLKNNDSQLRSTQTYQVKMGDRKSHLAFESDKPYISSLGEIGFKSVNVSKVSLVAERLLEQNRRYFMTMAQGNRSKLDNLGKEVLSRTFDIGGEKNIFQQHKIALKPFMKEWESGVYRLFIYYGDDRVSEKIVYFSDLGIAAKISKDQLFISVATLSSAKAVKGAQYKLYSNHNEVILEGITDENGIAVVNKENLAYASPVALEVISGKDRNFLILNRALNSVDNSDSDSIKNRYKAFVYLQSVLVRPGEDVSMLIVLKDKQYYSPSQLPVKVVVRDPMYQHVYESVHMTNNVGALSLVLPMPEAYKSGKYSVSVEFADRVIGEARYSLETFMPQQIKNKIDLSNHRIVNGGSVDMNLSADYLFGAPASALKAEVRMTAVSKNYKHPDYKGYSFVNTLLSQQNTINYLDLKQEFVLDEYGRHSVIFPVRIRQTTPSILAGQIGFTVFDDGRPVSAYKQLDIYPYSSMVGAYVANSSLKTDEELVLKTVVINPVSGKKEVHKLDVTLKRFSWYYNYDSQGYYHWHKEYKTVDTFSIESGKQLRKTMKRSGDYVLEVYDHISGHSATVNVRVSGWDYNPISPTDDFSKNEVFFKDTLYQKGDTLHADIKSPIIEGHMLVSVETDKVQWHKTFKITKGSATVDIPLNFDLGRGAYLFTSVVRSTDKAAGLIPYRAKSYSFIRPDREKYRIETTIKSVEQSESKRDLAVEVTSRPDSYILVSVVDEGILQILGQKPPKAFEFFNVKAGKNVAYFDLYDHVMHYLTTGTLLAFGGDDVLSLAKAKKHLPPKTGAKRVKPFVYWSGLHKTDSHGKVHVNIPIPEFNGKAEIVAVSLDKEGIGVGSKTFTVKDDLIIKPTFPRFTHIGDTITVPVRVFNTTDETKTIALSVKTSTNITILDASRTINIEPKSSEMFDIKMHATVFGKGEVTFSASSGSKQFSKTVELPVIQPYPLVTKTFYGEVTGTKQIKIPQKYMVGQKPMVDITLSNTFLTQLNDSVSKLIGYPHGCAEQTSSKMLAMANIEPFMYESDPIIRKHLLEDRNRFIEQGVLKLANIQKGSGEFSYWSYEGYVNIFASVYASDVLLTLKSEGYSVPDSVITGIDKSLDNLSRGYGSYRDGKTDDFIQLYAAYLLARSNKLDQSIVNALYDNKRYTNDLVKMYFMAAILNKSGNTAALQQILKAIENYDLHQLSDQRAYGNDFYSKTRNLAFALYLHVTNFSKNDLSYRLLSELAANLKNIYSTQDQAFAMRALIAYYGKNTSVNQMDGLLSLNGKKEYILQPMNISRLLTDDTVTLASKNGPINYSIEVSQYLPKPIKHTTLSGSTKALSIVRDYVDNNGNPLALDNIQQGKLIYSKIQIQSSSKMDNIAIVDRIPACFEIINERTNKMKRSNNTQNSANFKPNYQDYRDDRVLTFISLPSPVILKTNRVTFLTPLRAVSVGKCKLPALVAEVMYDPRISDYDKITESVSVKKNRIKKRTVFKEVKKGLRHEW